MALQHFMPRELPATLQPLVELSLDLRANWSAAAKELWRTIDLPLWEATGNPLLILGTVSRARLEALANNPEFIAHLQRVVEERRAYLEAPTWLAQTHGADKLKGIAYFSMEFGLSRALPIYSGGLGVLAGDYIKTASDMGLPMVGIGLLYQQGYFRQSLDAHGNQLAFFPFNDPLWLPVMPALNADNEWLRIVLNMPGRLLVLRVWQVRVGRVMLYLLDSNDPLNDPRDRGITSELYGGGPELRIQQEMVLGIGGSRLLRELDFHFEVCHLNEGHAAFAVLERARNFISDFGVDFATALWATRVGNLFTTHTPVADGFDCFSPQLVAQYLGNYAGDLGIDLQQLMALGRVNPLDAEEPFNMAWLALRGSAAVNGVSRLHGQVSRKIFAPLFPQWPIAEVPVGHVTNGVHVPTWSSRAADRFWAEICGEAHWRGDLASLEEDFRHAPAEGLWSLRCNARHRLVKWTRRRYGRQAAARGLPANAGPQQREMLDPDALTLGFARRFASYKRPNLLLNQPERLERLLTDARHPVQLVIAGKAHPQDIEGQNMIRAWSEFLSRPNVRPHAVFVEDYDMGVASELVHGVDLWLNTPRRPWEASGTSGMKTLVNGGLNLSELDGWWAEAWDPSLGWALGDGAEHDSDPAWDSAEAEALYRLLEQEVVPAFYQRDSQGIPQAWLSRMRESMASLTGRFSTNRMLRQYTEQYYLPAAADHRARAAEQALLAHELQHWMERVQHHWSQVRIGAVTRQTEGAQYHIIAEIYLDGLEMGDVCPELYAEALTDEEDAERIAMKRCEPLLGALGGYHYEAWVEVRRPVTHYTVRILAFHPRARLPLELGLIHWEQ
jgi:starch phosphorylase